MFYMDPRPMQSIENISISVASENNIVIYGFERPIFNFLCTS